MQEFLESLLGQNIWTVILYAALPVAFIIPYALITLYGEMKLSARIQQRLAYMRTGWKGTGQPFADIMKLMQKEDTIPTNADRPLFIMAPYIVFTACYAAYAALPFSSAYIGTNIELGIVYIIAVGSLSLVGILMGGWASNNKYSLIGAMRSAAQVLSYEIPVALAILVAVMILGTLNLSSASEMQSGGIQSWVVFGGPLELWQKLLLLPATILSFLLMLTGGIAEVNRTPFDLPEAESELVQGYNTEYSGMKFAMFYLAEYGNMFVVGAVATSLYLGGFASPFGSFLSGPVWGFVWFFLKGMMVIFLQIWVRWTLPRLRVDQLMYVSWKVFTPFLFLAILYVGLVLVL